MIHANAKETILQAIDAGKKLGTSSLIDIQVTYHISLYEYDNLCKVQVKNTDGSWGHVYEKPEGISCFKKDDRLLFISNETIKELLSKKMVNKEWSDTPAPYKMTKENGVAVYVPIEDIVYHADVML